MNRLLTLAFLSCTAISVLLAVDLDVTKIRLDEKELQTCEYFYSTYFDCFRLKFSLRIANVPSRLATLSALKCSLLSCRKFSTSKLSL